MSASEVVAVIAAAVAAAVGGALFVVLFQLRRLLADTRHTLETLRADTLAAVDELRAEARRAGYELDRVDALVTTASSIGETTDAATRLAYRTVSNPLVKALAFGSGARRAVRRLRDER